ncbi:MAG: hypothetical protein ACREGB_00945 [Candidatus Saccharimonadales bacterium]
MTGQEQTPEWPGQSLDELGERIAFWQQALSEADASNLGRIARQATEACDELWQYDGVYCTFSGSAVYPVVDENGGITITASELMAEGYSRGFVVEDFADTGDFRLYHMFYMGTHRTKPHPVVFNEANLFAYMAVDGEIVPHYEMDEALMPQKDPFGVEPVDIQERMQAIDVQSLKLVRLLQSRQFRKQPASKQASILDGFVKRCEQSHDLRDMGIMVENPDYCCRPYLRPDDVVEYEFIATGETLINGTVLGLATLERETLKHKPIRHTEDLINKAAGLCLVVSVSEVSEPTGLRPNDIVYIPTADQDMDASFFMQEIPHLLGGLVSDAPPTEGGPNELVG